MTAISLDLNPLVTRPELIFFFLNLLLFLLGWASKQKSEKSLCLAPSNQASNNSEKHKLQITDRTDGRT